MGGGRISKLRPRRFATIHSHANCMFQFASNSTLNPSEHPEFFA